VISSLGESFFTNNSCVIQAKVEGITSTNCFFIFDFGESLSDFFIYSYLKSKTTGMFISKHLDMTMPFSFDFASWTEML
jgi:hypothetical protein